ncbi:hypothetical protein EVAR_76650_1 [Eumeta japonica]|uniref:Uncharacterized protein n=1 Tax=Eumeta variegata TaxID=151549 RepID=A0A4C1T5J9_EUMVA|nr:hypothetical protein EVAR_76650_1 [Eumeta japonica]
MGGPMRDRKPRQSIRYDRKSVYRTHVVFIRRSRPAGTAQWPRQGTARYGRRRHDGGRRRRRRRGGSRRWQRVGSTEKKLEEEWKQLTAEVEVRLVRPPHWSTSSRI